MHGAQTTRVTGVAASAPLLLDQLAAVFAVGVYLDLGAGCTASVEATPDDVMNPAVTPVWYPCGVAALTGATADVAAGLGFPARAIRLNQTVGAGSSVMTVLQQGLR